MKSNYTTDFALDMLNACSYQEYNEKSPIDQMRFNDFFNDDKQIPEIKSLIDDNILTEDDGGIIVYDCVKLALLLKSLGYNP